MKLRHRSARSVCQPAGLLTLSLTQVLQVQAVAQMVVSFHQRRASDQKEPCEVGGPVATETFCDVTGRGTCRVPDLIAIFEILGYKWFCNNRINSTLQFVCELPTHEILIVPSHHMLGEGTRCAEP